MKLRLVVARFGEMDVAGWWNTKGVLARHGQMLLSRGFPVTHPFTQAGIVFAVARARCNERFRPPQCITLWNLPADLEDRFDEAWQHWLDEVDAWRPFFGELAALTGGPGLQPHALVDALVRLGLVTPDQARTVAGLRRSAEGWAVALPGFVRLDNDTHALLAAAFSRGEVGALAVPYARVEG
jgi:hypothetical protein